jgi:hypothetical protein
LRQKIPVPNFGAGIFLTPAARAAAHSTGSTARKWSYILPQNQQRHMAHDKDHPRARHISNDIPRLPSRHARRGWRSNDI